MQMFRLTVLLASGFVSQNAVEYRQPQVGASGAMVAVTFGSERGIYFASSQNGGKTWTSTVTVGEPGVLSLGNHRGPRVVITRGAMVISAVAGLQGKGVDSDLLTWRSTDGGKTWVSGTTITDRPGAAREGLHAMAAAPDGRLFATWLDLRNLTPGKPGTELWGAYSSDSGLTWSKNFVVYKSPDGTICQCCHPSAMFDAVGNLEVMWRNALGGNRDMYMARSKDGGHTFDAAEKLGQKSWHLDACPMDGGSLVQDSGGKIITVWRREKGIYLAPEGGAETLLQSGKNPAAAEGKNGLYIAWSSPEGLFARAPGQADPVQLDREGGFVTLTAIPNGSVLAAWERKGTIQFHTLL